MSIDFTKYYGKISNSGHDENRRYRGGKPGDQTGTEWQIINWYDRPWNCVLRYPDQKVAQKIAELAIKAANNNLIGYNQYSRLSYQVHLFASGYDPSQITIACDADCSAGVIANVKAVGHIFNIPALINITATYTRNMRAGFQAAGFKVLTDAKYTKGYSNLKPGDILLNEISHTATYVGKNPSLISKITNTITGNNKATVEAAQNYKKEYAGSYIVQATTGLNLRAGAGTSKTVLASISNNTPITCYGYYNVDPTTNHIWLYISYNGTKGFVDSTYLIKKTAAAVQSVTVSPAAASFKTGKVAASVLNVRTWAGTEYPTLNSCPTIKNGDEVEIRNTVKSKAGEDWYYIRIIKNNKYGFVMAKYIEVE